MLGDKFRIRFRKCDDLRFLSHHDLMRTFERMLRRAAIPFRTTSGFHPKPRMVFASSLPLGVVGLDEVVEVETAEPVDHADVLQRLREQAPRGLDMIHARCIPPNLTGQPCGAVYRLPVPADRRRELIDRCLLLLDQQECWVERTHPQPKRVDVRPYVLDLRVAASAGPADDPEFNASAPGAEAANPLLSLWMHLRITPTGSARADELVKLLGAADLLDAGSVLERTTLELQDETAPDRPPSPAGASSADTAALAAAVAGGPDALPDC